MSHNRNCDEGYAYAFTDVAVEHMTPYASTVLTYTYRTKVSISGVVIRSVLVLTVSSGSVFVGFTTTPTHSRLYSRIRSTRQRQEVVQVWLAPSDPLGITFKEYQTPAPYDIPFNHGRYALARSSHRQYQSYIHLPVQLQACRPTS